jgi:hypothetical protein
VTKNPINIWVTCPRIQGMVRSPLSSGCKVMMLIIVSATGLDLASHYND